MAFAGTVGKYNQLQLRSSEYTGTSNDPVLEVTYTMPAVTPPSTVITYAYDPQGQRITLTTPSATTHYPTKGYNSASSLPAGNTGGTNIVKHIGNVATVTGTGNNANVYYSSTDSLNSSSIMTDSAGVLAETLDYFPFGSLRFDNKVGSFSEQRKYIGQEFDADTGLNYLNARYYNSNIGRFISQDPMFWAIPAELLTDPQQQNSYAYARNNPIGLSDPSGLIPTTREAALMANDIYSSGQKGSNLTGSWKFDYSKAIGTGGEIGVYSREKQDKSIEYSLVTRGTTNFFGSSDLKNNFGQPFGLSSDVNDSLSFAQDFVKNNIDNEITFVGHSKGGAEAALNAVGTNKNAILFNPATANFSAYGLEKAKESYSGAMKSYIVKGEILSNFELNTQSKMGDNTYLQAQYSLPWYGRLLLGSTISSAVDSYNSYRNHQMSSIIWGLDNK